MGANIYVETVVPTTKSNIFHNNMIKFFNLLELTDKEYQKNGTIRYEKYKWNFLFFMNDFVSFLTDHEPMFYISNRFLKGNIDGICVTQFEINYIHKKNITEQ